MPVFPSGRFGTVLADPPWRYQNRRGKSAPEHGRLHRYRTLSLDEIKEIPAGSLSAEESHLYLWVPVPLVQEGLDVLRAWGWTYKTMLFWHKVRQDGGSDGRCMGFYFRGVVELVLFGIRGRLRTRSAGRRQVNLFAARKTAHSVKPDDLYPIIEACSPGPYIELFARRRRDGWVAWGDGL
jgi:N6-adenosine-specific RNA methylase IME4